jgi:HEAT repeat protein
MDKINDAANMDNQNAVIDSLIAELNCDDVVKCQKARRKLVNIGKPAVPSLMKLMSHKNKMVRWEALKILGKIADPATTGLFLDSLKDDDFDLRWLAAEGLVAIGKDALIPLLKAIIINSDSRGFRFGAHHVLKNLAGRKLYDTVKPVLAALEDVEPAVEAPVAAEMVLSKIAKK